MPVSFQARVGEGKVAYVAPGTRAIEGVSVVNADSILQIQHAGNGEIRGRYVDF